MPTEYVKELAKKHNVSVETAEKRWKEAKRSAEKEGEKDNYAYITAIFKRMMGENLTPTENVLLSNIND